MDGYGTSMHNVSCCCIGALAHGPGHAPAWMVGREKAGGYGIGRPPPTRRSVPGTSMCLRPEKDLPPGQGTVKQGAQVFAGKCAVCHGPTGTEGPKDRLVGGQRYA